MLGGFPYVSKVDLQGSKNFLAKLGVGKKSGKKIARAVDCGAGYVAPSFLPSFLPLNDKLSHSCCYDFDRLINFS